MHSQIKTGINSLKSREKIKLQNKRCRRIKQKIKFLNKIVEVRMMKRAALKTKTRLIKKKLIKTLIQQLTINKNKEFLKIKKKTSKNRKILTRVMRKFNRIVYPKL